MVKNKRVSITYQVCENRKNSTAIRTQKRESLDMPRVFVTNYQLQIPRLERSQQC